MSSVASRRSFFYRRLEHGIGFSDFGAWLAKAKPEPSEQALTLAHPQRHAESIDDGTLDGPRQADDIAGRSAAAVDDGEWMLR